MTRNTNAPVSARTRLTDPIRYPQTAPEPLRTKRAFTLLLMTLILPGSAQIVAGNRRLGRRALRVTFAVWAVVVVAVAMYFLNRSALLNIFTDPRWSLVLMIVLAVLAVCWAGIFLNTLRLIRPRLLSPSTRPIMGATLAVLMVLTSGSLGYAAYLLNVSRNAIGDIFQSGPAFAPVDGRYNFLLMGGDAGADRVGRRPDSISVLSIDADTGKVVTLGIPRNLQNAPFPADSPMHKVYPDGYNCGDDCIINSLYTRVSENYTDLYPDVKDPGAQAMVDAASGVVGLKIQAYVIVDMAGFSKIIDAMGGLTITVGGRVPIGGGTDLNTGLKNPIKGWIEPGKQHMDGNTALWYARSREGATDYDRMARQRCVQQAMISQLDPATLLTKFQAIASAGTKVIESDIPTKQLSSFLDLAIKAKGQKMTTLSAGPPNFNRDFPTYPDFAVLHQKVDQTIAKSEAKQQGGAKKGGSAAKSSKSSSGGSTGGSSSADQGTNTSPDTTAADTGSGITENGTCSAG